MGFKIKNSLTGEFEKLPILTLKGEKGETGGVEEYNKVDYMGNKYETLKQANDANVEYAVKTAIGEFNYLDYDGQHITATDTIEGQSKSAILKGNTLVNATKFIGNANSGGANYARYYSKDMLKKNTKYLCIWNAPSYVKSINLYTLRGGFIFKDYRETKRKFIITTNDTDDWGMFAPHFYPNDETGTIPSTDILHSET